MAYGSRAARKPRAVPRLTGSAWLIRLTLIAVSTLILANLVAALVLAGYQVYYDGLIFPGVKVWGVDLGGMSAKEAAAALNGKFAYPTQSKITFRDGNRTWDFTAGDLGVRFDVERTVQAAYGVGRQPDIVASLNQQAAAWREGVVMSPVIVFDQIAAETYLRQVAATIDRPVQEAGIQMVELAAVATPGQAGRTVNIPATLDDLGLLVTQLESGEVTLAIVETQPQIASTEETAKTINAILVSDIEVFVQGGGADDPGPWIASRQAVAQMLKVELIPAANGQPAHYDVRLDESQLQAFLEPLGPALARDPVDARFHFNRDSGQLEVLQPSIDGRTLNVPSSIQNINQLAANADHHIPLVFDTIPPGISDKATGEQLGIKELVSSATTYFVGSSQERKNNVRTAAARFNGVVVKPHEEFSFGDYLGDVSAETGFDTAWIIFNGRTIKGVGGGVCQVSTTAFQAAFYAGFPITMRVPHGYRVGYYEKGEGPGMDATVFTPEVDMRFMNDLDTHLLIETTFDAANQTLTFSFYATSDGRTVQKDGPFVSNIKPHPQPKYEENPDVPVGETRQVDFAADGADVRVVRTVYRNGQILFEDTFDSHYLPWQAVFQVAPGQLPPEGTGPPEGSH